MGIPPIGSVRPQWTAADRLDLKVVEIGLDRIGPFVQPPAPTPDGRGTYRSAAKGAMFQSDLYGGVFVAKAVMDVWSSSAVAKSAHLDESVIAIGSTVQVFLGLPIRNSSTVGDATVGWFENGVIVARPSGGFAVYGPIYIHYMKLGGPGGWVGLPTSNVLRAAGQPGPQGQQTEYFGGGTWCHFDACDIYWSKASGTAEVHGSIRDRYNAIGGSAGQLGFPTTDELLVHDSAALWSKESREIGRVSRFERGSIYWSGATGAWEVDQWMLPTYTEMQGPAGSLGFPTGAPSKSPGGARFYQNYRNGVLFRKTMETAVTRVDRLDLKIIRIEPFGGDGTFGGAVDVMVNLTATTSDGQTWSQRFPEGGGSYQGTAVLERVVHTFPIRDGGMILDLTFDAWDDEDYPYSDRRLGTIRSRHTIDNDWEVQTADTAIHDKIQITYNLDAHLPYDESKVRQQLFWQFPNVVVPELTQNHMAQTFRDVEQDEDWLLHPFNALFYEAVYKSFGDAGICFGLSLEAAKAHHGQSVSNEPINRYVSDPIRMNEAIVKHGYQLGGDQIDWFVEQYVLGNTRDPVRVFNKSREAYARGDFPILSISNDGTYSKGHAVMPYKWDTSNPRRWVMYICNPNHALPPGSGTENDGKDGNIVEIMEPNSPNAYFRYVHSQNPVTKQFDIWTGTRSSGGRMLAIPLHVLAAEPRTPFWEVLIAAIGATVIICADGGTTESVTVEPRPLGAGGSTDQLPPGITPIPFHDAPGRALQMLRVDRRAFDNPRAQSIAHQVRSAGRYSWGMRGPGVSAVVRTTGTAGVDTLSFGSRDTRKPTDLFVGAGNQGGVRAMALDLTGHGFAGPHRRFKVDRVSLPPGRSLTASLENGGEELSLRGDPRGPLKVRVGANRLAGALGPRELQVEPNQTLRVRPTDWRPERLGAAQLDVQVLDPGGAILSRRVV